jgi:hypothetical protein
MATTVDRHVPQPLPAPVLSITSSAVDTPAATSSWISFSHTATQMQTYIGVRPSGLVAVLDVENSFQQLDVNREARAVCLP